MVYHFQSVGILPWVREAWKINDYLTIRCSRNIDSLRGHSQKYIIQPRARILAFQYSFPYTMKLWINTLNPSLIAAPSAEALQHGLASIQLSETSDAIFTRTWHCIPLFCAITTSTFVHLLSCCFFKCSDTHFEGYTLLIMKKSFNNITNWNICEDVFATLKNIPISFFNFFEYPMLSKYIRGHQGPISENFKIYFKPEISFYLH